MQAKNRKSIQDQIDQATPHPLGSSNKLYQIGNVSFRLQVTPTGVKSWLYRYTLNGRTRAVGLGPAHRISFEEAERRARKIRVMLDEGIDPLAERDRIKREKIALEAASMTFQQCAEAYIEAHRAAWTKKHADQWPTSLANHAYPVLGNMPVSKIDVHAVKKVIEAGWLTKNETMGRVRARIEKVLGWATVNGYRQGDNPARWTAHLSELFPRRSKIRQKKHHPALPYVELPAFMAKLGKVDSIGSWALRFLILTAARTTEVRAATWDEIDLENKLWTIDASRMKARRSHRVPLSEPALDVLRFMKALNDAMPVPTKYVFPGQKKGTCPSEATMLITMKRMGRIEVPHGFRACFRSYMAEQTSFQREVAEAALAHQIENKVEAAYQRGDYLDKRREMMIVWAEHCMAGESPEPSSISPDASGSAAG